ncbi:MAG: hypothetical protein MHM6MM_002839 [Cercozoa sp. M6MM]
MKILFTSLSFLSTAPTTWLLFLALSFSPVAATSSSYTVARSDLPPGTYVHCPYGGGNHAQGYADIVSTARTVADASPRASTDDSSVKPKASPHESSALDSRANTSKPEHNVDPDASVLPQGRCKWPARHCVSQGSGCDCHGVLMGILPQLAALAANARTPAVAPAAEARDATATALTMDSFAQTDTPMTPKSETQRSDSEHAEHETHSNPMATHKGSDSISFTEFMVDTAVPHETDKTEANGADDVQTEGILRHSDGFADKTEANAPTPKRRRRKKPRSGKTDLPELVASRGVENEEAKSPTCSSRSKRLRNAVLMSFTGWKETMHGFLGRCSARALDPRSNAWDKLCRCSSELRAKCGARFGLVDMSNCYSWIWAMWSLISAIVLGALAGLLHVLFANMMSSLSFPVTLCDVNQNSSCELEVWWAGVRVFVVVVQSIILNSLSLKLDLLLLRGDHAKALTQALKPKRGFKKPADASAMLSANKCLSTLKEVLVKNRSLFNRFGLQNSIICGFLGAFAMYRNTRMEPELSILTLDDLPRSLLLPTEYALSAMLLSLVATEGAALADNLHGPLGEWRLRRHDPDELKRRLRCLDKQWFHRSRATTPQETKPFEWFATNDSHLYTSVAFAFFETTMAYFFADSWVRTWLIIVANELGNEYATDSAALFLGAFVPFVTRVLLYMVARFVIFALFKLRYVGALSAKCRAVAKHAFLLSIRVQLAQVTADFLLGLMRRWWLEGNMTRTSHSIRPILPSAQLMMQFATPLLLATMLGQASMHAAELPNKKQ